MSSQVSPWLLLLNSPMRLARNTVPGAAALQASAWPSSMPSISVWLPIRLRYFGSSQKRIRSAVQSSQLSPPSMERKKPQSGPPLDMFQKLRRVCQMVAKTMRPVLDALAVEHHTMTRVDEVEFIVDRTIRQAVATQAPACLILSPLLTGGKVFAA